jgi:hypothetical protein
MGIPPAGLGEIVESLDNVAALALVVQPNISNGIGNVLGL